MALNAATITPIKQTGSQDDVVQVEILYLDHNDQVRCATYQKRHSNALQED